MKTYSAQGTYTKRGAVYVYEKEITAANEKLAREKILAEIGGKQKIRRADILINTLAVKA